MATNGEAPCPDDDSTCVRHASTAEAAAQGMASSSDEAAIVDDLPRAYGRHVTGSLDGVATTGCRSDPSAASAVLTHSPSAGLPSPHMPMLASTPEQTSDAGQQQTSPGITGLPAITQQVTAATDATAESATAPRSDAVNGEAVSLAGAVTARPTHMPCARHSAASGRQQTLDAAAGATLPERPASAFTQAVPGLPGVSAEEVRQLLELMQSMQAAGAWPHGAPAAAEHGAHERALPAERMPDAMSVNSAVAHHMPDAVSGSPAVAHHIPDAMSGSSAVAHHMQPHEASAQLQVGRDASCVCGTKVCTHRISPVKPSVNSILFKLSLNCISLCLPGLVHLLCPDARKCLALQVAAAMSPSATSAASVAVISCPLKVNSV